MGDSERKIEKNRERLGKGWRKVEKSLCGFVKVHIGLWRFVNVCGDL